MVMCHWGIWDCKGVAGPAAMTAISYARFAYIVEEGTREALLPRCIGDFCVGACRCVPPSWLLF